MASTKDIANDFQGAATRVKDEFCYTGGVSKDNLEDVANKAGRTVRAYLENASDSVSEVSDKVTSQIRNEPVKSSLIALALGFVLGRMLRH